MRVSKSLFVLIVAGGFGVGFGLGGGAAATEGPKTEIRSRMRADFVEGIGMIAEEIGDRGASATSGPIRLLHSPRGLRWTRYPAACFIEKGLLDVSAFLNYYRDVDHHTAFVFRRSQDLPKYPAKERHLIYWSIWEALEESDHVLRPALLGFGRATLRWFQIIRHLAGLGSKPPDVVNASPDRAKGLVRWILDKANGFGWVDGRLCARIAAAAGSLTGAYEHGLSHALKLKPYIFSAYVGEGIRCGEEAALLALLAWFDARLDFPAGGMVPWLGLGGDPDGDDCLLTLINLTPFNPHFGKKVAEKDLFAEISEIMRTTANQARDFLKHNFTRLKWDGFRWRVAPKEVRRFPRRLFYALRDGLRDALKRWRFHGDVVLGLGYWQRLTRTLP